MSTDSGRVASLAAEIGVAEDPERLRREAALHTSIYDVGLLARRAEVGSLVLVRLRPPPVYEFQITRVVACAAALSCSVAAGHDRPHVFIANPPRETFLRDCTLELRY